MSGKFGFQLVTSTCRQSARVSVRMESLPLRSRDVLPGKAAPPGSEWGSDTGTISGSASPPARYQYFKSAHHPFSQALILHSDL